MSRNTICRDKYYNYGSYLRSRGFDQYICQVITDLEAGKINVGSITPGLCPSKPTTILGNTWINPCPTAANTGQLYVTGGNILSPSNYGLQVTKGAQILGPINQNTGNCTSQNTFAAATHFFTGGPDCSTNVVIDGTLTIDASFVIRGVEVVENQVIATNSTNPNTSFRIFRSPNTGGNTVAYYEDTSTNLVSGEWERGLIYAIDGEASNPLSVDTPSNPLRVSGMTNQPGHIRGFRGMTISNPPQYGADIDICYNRDLSGGPLALDVYGSILVQNGNNNAPGNIDISGGIFTLSENGNSNVKIYSNGDASFNGHVTVYDLSVVNFATIGTSTVYLDTTQVRTPLVTSKTSEDIILRAGTGANNITLDGNKIILDGDLSANGAIVLNDISVSSINITGNLNASTGFITDLSVNNLTVNNEIKAPLLQSVTGSDLTLRTGLLGNSNNIILDGNKIIVDGDLSANGIINCNTININDKLVINDLSVNSQASITDLSVNNYITVGSTTEILGDTIRTSLIDCALLQVSNTGYFNQDLSVNNNLNVTNHINAPLLFSNTGSDLTLRTGLSGNSNNIILDGIKIVVDGDLSANGTINCNTININDKLVINDLSVNSQASIYDLSVNTININDKLVINDLSVNLQASINDISANTIDTNTIYTNNLTTNSFLDISSETITFNDKFHLQTFSNATFLTTSTTTGNSNSLDITTSQNGSNGIINLSCGGQLDITSGGYTTISPNQGLDICANENINIVSGLDISLNASYLHFRPSGWTTNHGDLRINGGNLYTETILSTSELQTTSLGGNTTIQAGPTSNNDIVMKASDISFVNVENIFVGDASLNLTKNPNVRNTISSTPPYYRDMTCYGQSTTILDICNQNLNLPVGWSTSTKFRPGTYDLSINNVLYSDLDPLALQNNIFNATTGIIDFSNNSEYVNNCIFELSVSSAAIFDDTTSSLTFKFRNINPNNNSIPVIKIDTRSINADEERTVCFGPQSFVFSENSNDNIFIGGQFVFEMDISGSSIQESKAFNLTGIPRITIKQKSII